MAKKVAKKIKDAMKELLNEEEEIEESIEEVLEEVAVKVEPKAAPKVEAKGKSPDDLVEIEIHNHIKIAGQRLQPGIHRVPRHQADSIIEIEHKKRISDMKVFVGKNYLVEKLMGSGLSIKEVADIDLKKIAGV